MKKTALRILGVCAAALAGYALVENHLLLRTAYNPLSTAETGFRVPRMVMVSDVHKRQFGKGQHRLIAAVAKARPEYIILTGDLISRNVTDFADTEALLRGLADIAPMLMVWGNHELDCSEAQRDALRKLLQTYHVRLLENEIIQLGDVHFAGLTLEKANYRNGSGFRHLKRCTTEEIQALLGPCPQHTILLAHNPLYAEAYAAWGADVVLSGHVHGGIVRLPLVGGLLSPERKFFPAFAKGRYNLGKTILIVSGGLGKFRLLNPAEIRCIFSLN